MKTMIKRLLYLCIISFLFVGCHPASSLQVSKAYIGSAKKCAFNSINAPIYKFTNDKTGLRSNVYKSPNRHDDLFMNSRLIKHLTNRKIKIIGYEPWHDKYFMRDKYSLFDAGGNKHICANGLFKAITEDCRVIYLNTKEIIGYSGNLITKIDSSPLNDEDKLEMAKYFKPVIDNMKVTINEDIFEGNKWIKTPSINNQFLRALIDINSKQLQFVQIYAKISHYSDWAHLDSAKDKEHNSFEVVQIDTDVDCSGPLGCLLYETIGINISPAYLSSHTTSGIEIQASGRKGKSLINIPSKIIKLMVIAINDNTAG